MKSKIFRDPVCPATQELLLPPQVGDFVAEGSRARILSEIVDSLDISVFRSRYQGGGAPAFHPKMMLKVWLFALMQGIRSSRRLDELLGRDLHFMYLAEMARPDFRTLSGFRRRHEKEIQPLFVEVVRMCLRHGLVMLEDTAADGTKIQANVSRKQTYKKDRLERTLEGLEERISEVLAEANAVDAAEDAADLKLGDEKVPTKLRDRKSRERAFKQLEADLHGDAEDAVAPDTGEPAAPTSTDDGDKGAGTPETAHPEALAVKVGDEKLARKLRELEHKKEVLEQARAEIEKQGSSSVCATDLESRAMKTSDGVKSAFNTQAVVDKEHHIVVAASVTQNATDNAELPGLLDQVAENTGLLPQTVMADSGYHNDAALKALEDNRVDGYLKQQPTRPGAPTALRDSCTYDPDKDQFVTPEGEVLSLSSKRVMRGVTIKHYRTPGRKYTEITVRDDDGRLARMRAKLATPEGIAQYRLRQEIVEPVFAHLKGPLNLQRFLLRGLAGARIEYLLTCTAHNLGKLVGHLAAARQIR
jgi:transposase